MPPESSSNEPAAAAVADILEDIEKDAAAAKLNDGPAAAAAASKEGGGGKKVSPSLQRIGHFDKLGPIFEQIFSRARSMQFCCSRFFFSFARPLNHPCFFFPFPSLLVSRVGSRSHFGQLVSAGHRFRLI